MQLKYDQSKRCFQVHVADHSCIVFLVPYELSPGWTYRAISDSEWGVYDERGELRRRIDASGHVR